jgi:hypothetical protein
MDRMNTDNFKFPNLLESLIDGDAEPCRCVSRKGASQAVFLDQLRHPGGYPKARSPVVCGSINENGSDAC